MHLRRAITSIVQRYDNLGSPQQLAALGSATRLNQLSPSTSGLRSSEGLYGKLGSGDVIEENMR